MFGSIKLVKSFSLLSNISNSGPERNTADSHHWLALHQSGAEAPPYSPVQGFSPICSNQICQVSNKRDILKESKDYFNFLFLAWTHFIHFGQLLEMSSLNF